MEQAPIALFVYNRLRHVQETIDALKKNRLAEESNLFIFSDAPGDKEAEDGVLKVREYIKTIAGFSKIMIIERDRNFGLSASIINGVSELIVKYGKVIVLEDDLVTSPWFLKFMNNGLSTYQDEEKVISICGYMYPLSKKYTDTMFLRIADSWGWATWKRGWDLFTADGKELLAGLKARGLFKRFDLDGMFNYTGMLKRQIQGKNDSWAIRWYASAILNGRLSLYPWKSLVMNTGFDGSGRHGGVVDFYKTELLDGPVDLRGIPVLEDEYAIGEIGLYLKRQRFNIGFKALEFFRKRWYDNGPAIQSRNQ